MRLAITRSGFFAADHYCADARSAKKTLREQKVSLVAIDYDLVGNSNGCDLLAWAAQQALLPHYVVVIENNRVRRTQLAIQLQKVGYRSGDQATFVRC